MLDADDEAACQVLPPPREDIPFGQCYPSRNPYQILQVPRERLGQRHQHNNRSDKPFDSLQEFVAFGFQELSEQGVDRLLKILSHPQFQLSKVVGVVRNKATFFDYIAQQPHLVSWSTHRLHATHLVICNPLLVAASTVPSKIYGIGRHTCTHAIVCLFAALATGAAIAKLMCTHAIWVL